MKKISINLIALLCLIFTFSSCLTYEKKETTVKFEGKNRGTLTVKYTDIRSSFSPDEGTSINEQTLADYQSLIDDYLKGDKLMEDFPHAEIQSKRLFEENGKLCGEVIFRFSTLEEIKIMQYEENGPYLYSVISFDEELEETNGKMGPDYFPAIYWENSSNPLSFTMVTTEDNNEKTSLLELWKRDNH